MFQVFQVYQSALYFGKQSLDIKFIIQLKKKTDKHPHTQGFIDQLSWTSEVCSQLKNILVFSGKSWRISVNWIKKNTNSSETLYIFQQKNRNSQQMPTPRYRAPDELVFFFKLKNLYYQKKNLSSEVLLKNINTKHKNLLILSC